MAAPAFAELAWTETVDGRWTTIGTSEFWNYYNVARGAFKALGFEVSKPEGKWIVVGPDIDAGNKAAFADLLSRVHEHRAAAADRHRAAYAAQEARDAERREKRAEEAREARERVQAEILEARSLRHSKVVAEARSAGQTCLDRWGILVHRKDKLRDLVRLELLTHAQIRLVHRLVSETEAKVASIGRQSRAVQDDECVTWSDDAVERAVRHLTALDSDHARDPNKRGWSGSDSGRGHWAVAVMETDRPAALRMARKLVGHYREQLSAILTPQEMP